MAGTNSLKRFLKKIPVQRNTKINRKRNGVVTLPRRLRMKSNFSHIFTHGDVVNTQIWEVSPQKIQSSHLILNLRQI